MLTGRAIAAKVTLLLALPTLAALAWAVREQGPYLDLVDPWLISLRVGPWDALLDAVDLAGSLVVWALAVTVLTLLVARVHLWAAAELLLLAVGGEVAATGIKILVGRARPLGADVGDLLVASGFPSGHVTRIAVLIGIALLLGAPTARWRAVLLLSGVIAVVLMGIARVSSGAHYTSDVIGGWLLAAAILATWTLWPSRVVSRGRAAESQGAASPQRWRRIARYADGGRRRGA